MRVIAFLLDGRGAITSLAKFLEQKRNVLLNTYSEHCVCSRPVSHSCVSRKESMLGHHRFAWQQGRKVRTTDLLSRATLWHMGAAKKSECTPFHGRGALMSAPQRPSSMWLRQGAGATQGTTVSADSHGDARSISNASGLGTSTASGPSSDMGRPSCQVRGLVDEPQSTRYRGQLRILQLVCRRSKANISSACS